ncbi:MAG: hypothetical protein H6601_11640 [Flavobacteriales bacterium]|nr:hypothetical protein [Flavobacteriales bacterium]
MKLHINDALTISEIQEEFGKVFPYLKIEFFKKPHETGETSPKSEMLPSDATLAKWRTVHNEGDLTVTAETTVEEVETGCQNKFGISAQVFRKSGDIWLETSATDHWTLKEQNEQGEFMAQEVGE